MKILICNVIRFSGLYVRILVSGWGVWLPQSLEHVTLDIRSVSSSPTLGLALTLIKKKKLSE